MNLGLFVFILAGLLFLVLKIIEHKDRIKEAFGIEGLADWVPKEDKSQELINELVKAIDETKRLKIELGALERKQEMPMTIFRICVSVVVLLAALFVIVHGQQTSESEKWAIGAVGTILGYWLK